MKNKYLATAICAAIFLSGCASIQPKTAEELVNQRASDRWKLLVKGELKKAYNYLQPSYRGLRSDSYYSNSIGRLGQWTAADVISVKCDESLEKCDVKVKVTASLHVAARPVITSTVVDEVWINEDGKWWKFEKI